MNQKEQKKKGNVINKEERNEDRTKEHKGKKKRIKRKAEGN